MTKKKARLNLPISDTIPGPGNFEADIIVDEHDASKIPSVEKEDAPDYIGHGTANDVTSTPLTPDPDDKNNTL